MNLHPTPVAVIDGYSYRAIAEPTADNPYVRWGCSWIRRCRDGQLRRVGDSYSTLEAAQAVYERVRDKEPMLAQLVHGGAVNV